MIFSNIKASTKRQAMHMWAGRDYLSFIIYISGNKFVKRRQYLAISEIISHSTSFLVPLGFIHSFKQSPVLSPVALHLVGYITKQLKDDLFQIGN